MTFHFAWSNQKDICYQNTFRCTNSCPCGPECPEGCSNSCSSSFCKCHGEPEQDVDYLICQEAAYQDYRHCVIMCQPHDQLCISDCTRAYDDNIYQCPCQPGCLNGCPCPEYECVLSTTDPATTTEPSTTRARYFFFLKLSLHWVIRPKSAFKDVHVNFNRF